MYKIQRKQKLSFSALQLYQLVADIEHYPEFIPWCQQVKILRAHDYHLDARVVVGFKGIRQSYHCRVHCEPETHTISVKYLSGPLADLYTRWQFTDITETDKPRCEVDFCLNFALRNRLLSGIVDRLMLGAVEKMTEAFINRAHTLYASA